MDAKKIQKLAIGFYRLSQQQPVDAAYMNHVIRINQQADELTTAIEAGIQAGSTRPEAKSYVDSLKNLAVRLTQLAQQNSELMEQQSLLTELTKLWNTIATSYVDQTYEPMKQIKESIAYANDSITKQMENVEI